MTLKTDINICSLLKCLNLSVDTDTGCKLEIETGRYNFGVSIITADVNSDFVVKVFFEVDKVVSLEYENNAYQFKSNCGKYLVKLDFQGVSVHLIQVFGTKDLKLKTRANYYFLNNYIEKFVYDQIFNIFYDSVSNDDFKSKYQYTKGRLFVNKFDEIYLNRNYVIDNSAFMYVPISKISIKDIKNSCVDVDEFGTCQIDIGHDYYKCIEGTNFFNTGSIDMVPLVRYVLDRYGRNWYET